MRDVDVVQVLGLDLLVKDGLAGGAGGVLLAGKIDGVFAQVKVETVDDLLGLVGVHLDGFAYVGDYFVAE